MQIDKGTKIDDLIKQYPFLINFLTAVSPKFKALKNPIMRKTVGKVATIEKAALIGGMDPDDLISTIAAEVRKQTGENSAAAANTSPSNGIALADPVERQKALKNIIKDLHEGEEMEALKERFKHLIQGVEATEVAKMEQALMDEGMPAEEIKRLCDVHVEIFKEALEAQDRPDPPPGHPIHTFMKENRASEAIMSRISIVLGLLGNPIKPDQLDDHRAELGALIEQLADINIHYTRKENQLFPMLEAHHFTGPSQVMWSIHDDIRTSIKLAGEAFSHDDPEQTAVFLKASIQAIRDMIYKEEHILFPTSLDMLSEAEWLRVKDGESEIGFAWVTPDHGWPDEKMDDKVSAAVKPAPDLTDVAGVLGLSTGGLTLEQINLLLTHLPIDLTFVDDQDRVLYYSEGPERIFPRSPGIIGREVRNCHPPKSVHIVNKILDTFKSGDKDKAEFWIQLGGKFIYIRYFAVRDAKGRYRGTLEVSQDITDLRRLEGESRLLDWD